METISIAAEWKILVVKQKVFFFKKAKKTKNKTKTIWEFNN